MSNRNRAMLSEDYAVARTHIVIFGMCLPVYAARLAHYYGGSFRVAIHCAVRFR